MSTFSVILLFGIVLSAFGLGVYCIKASKDALLTESESSVLKIIGTVICIAALLPILHLGLTHHKVDNVLSGPTAEDLKEKPAEVKEPSKLDLKAEKNDVVKEAQTEQEQSLKDFEQ